MSVEPAVATDGLPNVSSTLSDRWVGARVILFACEIPFSKRVSLTSSRQEAIDVITRVKIQLFGSAYGPWDWNV